MNFNSARVSLALRLLAALSLLASLAWSPLVSAGALVASTDSGRVQGKRMGPVAAYLGVPYAAPPVGDLRWRAPAPAASWQGVRDATRFQAACPQRGVSMPGEPVPVTGEDCLYLNVWKPVGTAARKPVMVFIHGGGYTNGATALPLYGGESLARRGVVVVSVNYRLGALGFLAHPELSAESGGSSGNYGLLDQVAALQWVQRNIANFGGDPGNVTVFGQSAGAMSVSLLMASPRAKGLFHRAIAQSGGVFEPLQLAPGYRLANAEKDGVAYAAALGASTLAGLRVLPAERLLVGSAGQVSHPVFDTDVLPYTPYEAYVAGRMAKVPVLMGANAQEAQSLVDVTNVRADNFAAELTRAWGPLPPRIAAAYVFTNDVEAKQARLDLERDLRFGWDMWAWARLQAASGTVPAYAYRFTHSPPFPTGSVRAGWGPSHYAELWYMFDHLDQEPWAWRKADRRLAHAMASYWVNFARTGNPNGVGLPYWPAFDARTQQVMGLGEKLAPMAHPDVPTLRAFDQTYDMVRGAPFGQPSPQ
jgi:para-nitrobenzyl esterase